MSHQKELTTWFMDVKKWAIEDCCDTRRVWLDIIGIPSHGWKWENFKRIAELWGRFISLGKSISYTKSFEVMRVLIATDRCHRIDSEILFTLDNCGYRVTIREASTSYQVNQVTQHNSSSTKVEDRVSAGGIPGFEDMEDDEDASNYHHDQEVVEETPAGQINMRSVIEKGTARSYDSHTHAGSRTKTRTVSFSQNGYSVNFSK